MIDEYGISVYTHETTHVNDGHIYLGGFGRREGTSFEAFAQGMLQTPVAGSGFDEFGSLGINMVFKRPNDGNQWVYHRSENSKNKRRYRPLYERL